MVDQPGDAGADRVDTGKSRGIFGLFRVAVGAEASSAAVLMLTPTKTASGLVNRAAASVASMQSCSEGRA